MQKKKEKTIRKQEKNIKRRLGSTRAGARDVTVPQ